MSETEFRHYRALLTQLQRNRRKLWDEFERAFDQEKLTAHEYSELERVLLSRPSKYD